MRDCTTYNSVDVLDAAMGHSSSSMCAGELENFVDGGIAAMAGKNSGTCQPAKP